VIPILVDGELKSRVKPTVGRRFFKIPSTRSATCNEGILENPSKIKEIKESVRQGPTLKLIRSFQCISEFLF
jgi:hypothetical protein